jgi:hypothetical protein
MRKVRVIKKSTGNKKEHRSSAYQQMRQEVDERRRMKNNPLTKM